MSNQASESTQDCIHSEIWDEDAQEGNPFRADRCYCRGYDVFGDLLPNASYIAYLFLLFRREKPTPQQASIMEALMIALANPGPRDPSVHAAMCAGVGGSPAAAALVAALSVGAGSYGGAREIRLALERWAACGKDIEAWRPTVLPPAKPERSVVWPDIEHAPGFDPYASVSSTMVNQLLHRLASLQPGGCAEWLLESRQALEAAAGLPLSICGVVAAGFTDLGFSPAEGEMLALLFRLPGAAAHAIEQVDVGFRKFPFFAIDVENDPLKPRKT
ncbi:citrate synthase family protein [Parachitinimonas caeni]|uniref:Citryl-CoA lyase n=1 Tax=Parachitinimonas caeni TaxID=3031301 RepID=A0ABT7E4A5_9NEIS|nr:citryl-CoA lyase [Parachitinimonas caeni]MDK2126894.1 citryl-CoA lyase [Parachitinimonas caeni]